MQCTIAGFFWFLRRFLQCQTLFGGVSPGSLALGLESLHRGRWGDLGRPQARNSLNSQRGAAEAFIASQKSEGWVCLPKLYDDGGFTGGNLDRPAFKRLMHDIEAGEIDCVVVYKVDRLSRSLLDFAKAMETFDANGVSFVSVTQQFNTTHSMGRLTLNILLLFAQFEHDIIGERFRNKIAAQRQKGLWCGGDHHITLTVCRQATTTTRLHAAGSSWHPELTHIELSQCCHLANVVI